MVIDGKNEEIPKALAWHSSCYHLLLFLKSLWLCKEFLKSPRSVSKIISFPCPLHSFPKDKNSCRRYENEKEKEIIKRGNGWRKSCERKIAAKCLSSSVSFKIFLSFSFSPSLQYLPCQLPFTSWILFFINSFLEDCEEDKKCNWKDVKRNIICKWEWKMLKKSTK